MPPKQLTEGCYQCTIDACGIEEGTAGACHGMGKWPRVGNMTVNSTFSNSSVEEGMDVKYYSVGPEGELGFLDSIERSWNGGAKPLAILLLVASGINPYLENIILMIVMFAPLKEVSRERLLWFANRFGRWTFVDVFCVSIICCAVNLWVLDGTLHVRTLSKVGIYAFGLATIWARIQGACIEVLQKRSEKNAPKQKQRLPAPRPVHLRILASLAFVLCVVAVFAPCFRFTVDDHTSSNENIVVREFSLMELGVEQGPSEGAAVLGPIFMAVTYYTFIMLVPMGQHLALIAAPSNPRMIQVVDRVGSAGSLDVFCLAAVITVSYYGKVVHHTTRCWKRHGDPDIVTATGEVLWGFVFLVLYVPVQWALTEMVTKYHGSLSSMGSANESKEAQSEPKEVEAGLGWLDWLGWSSLNNGTDATKTDGASNNIQRV